MIAPTAFVDETRALLAETEEVTLAVSADMIRVEAQGRQISGQPLEHDFPNYRRLLADEMREEVVQRVTVDVPALRKALAPGAAPTMIREHHGVMCDVAVLAIDPAGTLAVVAKNSWGADESSHVAVNHEFLLDALDAGGRGQLVLELDGPIRPLAVRNPDDEQTFSILMPIRL